MFYWTASFSKTANIKMEDFIWLLQVIRRTSFTPPNPLGQWRGTKRTALIFASQHLHSTPTCFKTASYTLYKRFDLSTDFIVLPLSLQNKTLCVDKFNAQKNLKQSRLLLELKQLWSSTMRSYVCSPAAKSKQSMSISEETTESQKGFQNGCYSLCIFPKNSFQEDKAN